MTDTPVLRLEGVTVVRGGEPVLDRVDWTVREGERWVVLGSNGAGKTTLLQVAAGVLRPTRGAVELLGAAAGEVDAELRSRIGWTSASLGDRLPRRERVLDVVLTAGYARLRRGDEPYAAGDEARARRLLGQLGCRVLADRRYGSLSEGERRRVHIARSLMTDPELLLLDEPGAGLDLLGREAFTRWLLRLAGDPAGPVPVLVTHRVEEIPPGFTHALLLRRGRVLAAGDVGVVCQAGPLSACFGLPLAVERQDGRLRARAAFAPA